MLFTGIFMAGVHYLFFKYYNTGYFESLIQYAKGMGLDDNLLRDIYTLPNHLRNFVFYPSYGLVLGALSGWWIGRKFKQVS